MFQFFNYLLFLVLQLLLILYYGRPEMAFICILVINFPASIFALLIQHFVMVSTDNIITYH